MGDPDRQGVGQFRRIESIFVEVCDLPEEQRGKRLQELCDGDQDLLTCVVEMLHADRTHNDILEHPIISVPDAPAEPIPERIGEFEIISVLGEGGMGIVYEALQKSPNREVALKVIRQRSLHEQIRKRFLSEADILGRINHPGIATIYESGVSNNELGGQPYVAMELVEGLPVNQYADELNCSTRQRIGLMRDICRAIGYVHSLGIVHRDLKPSNLFVTNNGQIKVLDFGIALDMEIDQRTQMTQTGQLVGTLQYMAPEQVDRGHHKTVPQTDVYALGLICYELLAGDNPVGGQGSSIYDLVNSIRDQDAELLGTHDKSFRGDLEIIVSKALAKQVDRRYTDAGAMADDLDRYLKNKPIEARKPSAWYQLRMFSKRNPAIVGSMGAVVLVLVIALALISNALRNANHQRALAERGAYTQNMVNRFLTDDLFAAASPSAGGDPDVSLLEAMRVAADGLSSRFSEAPEVEAEIRYTIGWQFLMMNKYPEARTHLERCVQLSEQLGLDIDTIAQRRNALCQLYSDVNELEYALEFVRDTRTLVDESNRASIETRVLTLMEHASLLFHLSRTQECMELFEQAVRLGRDEAPDAEYTWDAIADLALVYTRMERYEQSLPLHEITIEHSIETLGPEHPETLVSLDNLCVLYLSMQRFRDAETLSRGIIDARIRVYGPDHLKTYLSKVSLARALSGLGQHDEAVALVLESHAGQTSILGREHRYVRLTSNWVIKLLNASGQPDRASEFASTLP